MNLKTFGTAAVIALTLAGTTAATVQPAAAWCRFGRCGFGGYGWRGGYYRGGFGVPLAAGLVAGAVVGTAAVAAGARPYGYGYGYGYGRPGGYFACPAGYHFGPGGRSCFAN